MKHLIKEGEISLLLPEGEGGGLSGEVHLIKHRNEKYVVRRCSKLSIARGYEDISIKFEKYKFLPRFLGRYGKDVFYEYVEGRDLRDRESPNVFEQIGKISARINKIKVEGEVDSRFKEQIKELVTGNFKLGVKEKTKRKRTNNSRKPKAILSKEEGKTIEKLYYYLKKKSKPSLTLDANDITPGNFRLGKDGNVYFVDVEAIRPRIKGFGIAKFHLQWGKTPMRKKAFDKGYSSVSSMKFLTEDYLDFIYLNFLVQKLNYKIKIFKKNNPKKFIKPITKLINKYSKEIKVD